MQEISDIVDFINDFYHYFNNLQEEYVSILSCITYEDISRVNYIKEMYGMLEKDTFNIFEPLVNYQKEKFNEIILTQILDPKTKEIRNIEFLNIFCKLLSENLPEKPVFHFENDVVVEKQSDYIDILISDKNNAIIIESKINGAGEPKKGNQLARYYRHIQNKLKKKVLCVVYIRPIYDDTKEPPLDDYDAEYASETAEIREKLVCLSVIEPNQKNDLCHGFLDVCSRITTNEKAKFYIQQYSELLKLKGGSKMLTNVGKELLGKLYSDAESVKKMQVVAEVYDKRWEILASIIKDSLYKKGFNPVPRDEHDTAKRINEKIHIVFTDYDGEKYRFGFWYEKTPKSVQKSLEDLLKNYENKLLDVKVINEKDWIIYREFKFEIDQPINDIVDTIIRMYMELEKMAVDCLNNCQKRRK
jgi:hypothetical protein